MKTKYPTIKLIAEVAVGLLAVSVLVMIILAIFSAYNSNEYENRETVYEVCEELNITPDYVGLGNVTIYTDKCTGEKFLKGCLNCSVVRVFV